MIISIPSDLERQIQHLIASGNYQSEADVLRAAITALATQDADMVAVREGIADLEQNRVRPLPEVAAEIRMKHSWTDTE